MRKPTQLKRRATIFMLCTCLGLAGLNAAPEQISDIRASASSEFKQYKAAKAVDGKISDDSRWVSEAAEEDSWLLLEWDAVQTLQGVHLFSGWGDKAAVRNLNMHFRDAAGKWVEIPSATLDGNTEVGLWHFERITYQPSIDFMVDSRHYVGNYRKRCRGSFGWRDDHHFAWVLRSIVPQYLSNPAAYERMPKQIQYEAPRDKLWVALEPYDESAPDIVKLIHWGADVTVTQGTIHEMLKGELAYFLYAWPWLKEWLPQQNYDAVLSFAQKTWALEEADRKYPYEDPATRERIRELVWSHMDNSFGRNPCGRHFSYDAPREIEGVEHGWYSYYKGGIGQLAEARFVLDGAPKHVHYPYHPERGNYGWTEGWVNFNSAFNHSLAYMAKADTEIHLKQDGTHLQVALKAPLNFDPQQSEPVEVTIEGKKIIQLKLVEVEPDSPYHIGRIDLTKLGARPGDRLRASYGYGYMQSEAELTVK